MTDTYDELLACRAANLALQILINKHRLALVALVRQPFSPRAVEHAKDVCKLKIDTSDSEQLVTYVRGLHERLGEDLGEDTTCDPD